MVRWEKQASELCVPRATVSGKQASIRSDSSIDLYLLKETPEGYRRVGGEGRLGSGGTWGLLAVYPITFPDF